MLSKILIVGMLAAAIAFAQGGWGKRNEDPSGGMMAQRQSQLDQFADKLKLNKEQRAQAETIMDAAREAMGPAQQKLIEARKNLAAALIGGQSGDAVDKLDENLRFVICPNQSAGSRRVRQDLRPAQAQSAIQSRAEFRLDGAIGGIGADGRPIGRRPTRTVERRPGRRWQEISRGARFRGCRKSPKRTL
jgi:Spy/CpxP family protein refolding chaperone